MTQSLKSTEETVHIRNKICRFCLEEQDKLAELDNLFFDDIRFLDILKECLGIEINLSQDHLPLLICQKCLVTTLNFQSFRNTVLENEVFLQNVNLDELNLKLHASSNQINLNGSSRNSESAINDDEDDQVHSIEQNQDSTFTLTSISQYQTSESIASFKPNMEGRHELKGQIAKKTNPIHLSPPSPLVINHVEAKINFFEGKNVPIGDTNTVIEEKLPSITSESSGYACSICSLFFNNHKYLNHGTCENCNQANTKRRTSIKPTSGKIYACSACKQQFSKASEWKEHMISHYAMQMYHCLQCSCSFDSKHELIVHTYSHLYLKTEARRKKEQATRRKNCKMEKKEYSKIF